MFKLGERLRQDCHYHNISINVKKKTERSMVLKVGGILLETIWPNQRNLGHLYKIFALVVHWSIKSS